MTEEEQEALSHQHFGVWVVALSTGRFAVFTHPMGKLIDIVSHWNIIDVKGIAPDPVPRAKLSQPHLNLKLDL